MERRTGAEDMPTKALIKAIIRILIDNNVSPEVVNKIRELIQ